MKSNEEILAEAESAARAGATRYCMVLSGGARASNAPASSQTSSAP